MTISSAAWRPGWGVPASRSARLPPSNSSSDDEGEAVDLADLVDLHDIGVMEPRDRFRLEPETVQLLRPGLEAGPDHLQGDQTLQLSLPGLVDHPHATVAQLLQDLVVSDLGPTRLADTFFSELREGFFRIGGFPPGMIRLGG